MIQGLATSPASESQPAFPKGPIFHIADEADASDFPFPHGVSARTLYLHRYFSSGLTLEISHSRTSSSSSSSVQRLGVVDTTNQPPRDPIIPPLGHFISKFGACKVLADAEILHPGSLTVVGGGKKPRESCIVDMRAMWLTLPMLDL